MFLSPSSWLPNGRSVNSKNRELTDRPFCKRRFEIHHQHHYHHLFLSTTPIQVATTSNYTCFPSYFFPSPPMILLVFLGRTYTQTVLDPNPNPNSQGKKYRMTGRGGCVSLLKWPFAQPAIWDGRCRETLRFRGPSRLRVLQCRDSHT
jgi:hypothetical protein